MDTRPKEALKYLKFPEGANASYKVLQKGHQVQISFRQGNLSLLIAADGTGTFVDSIHRLEHKVSVTGGIPNTTYPIDFIYFGNLETDESQKELAITANLSAWEGRSIFNMQIRFIFDGTTFTPISMASWDDGKYGADKGSGKEIKSLNDYLQFSYSL